MQAVAATERAKWQAYYANLPFVQADPGTEHLGEELAGIVRGLLPDGGTVLEAGCGGGWQSLALARTGLYRLTLMDFAAEALEYARRVFDANGATADFILGDAAETGTPAFDLVFNAGLLEHYNFDEQAGILRAMATKSHGYVVALVPNIQCYWYWLWRLRVSSQGGWQWGREVPLSTLAPQFAAAGLDMVSESYIGEAWTETFIRSVADSRLAADFLDIHRSKLLPRSQTCYLLVSVGRVRDASGGAPPTLRGDSAEHRNAILTAAVADSVATRMSELAAWRAKEEAAVRQHEQQLEALQTALSKAKAELFREREKYSQTEAAYEIDREAQRVRIGELSRLHRTLEADLAAARVRIDELRKIASESVNRSSSLQARLTRETDRSSALANSLERRTKQVMEVVNGFSSASEKFLAEVRGQRAWRCMLAIRKAYDLWTRRGWRGRVAALGAVRDALSGGPSLHAYELPFPSIWDDLPPDLFSTPTESGGALFAQHRSDVVVFSIFDFEFRFQRPQQIAAQLARDGHRVFWISPSRRPTGKPAFESVPLRENLWEVRLPVAPVDLYRGELSTEMAESISHSLGELYRQEGIAEAMALVQFPFWRRAALALRERFDTRVVYDCMDDWPNWTADPRISDFSLAEEAALARECDVLVATSSELARRLEVQSGRAAVRIRNGADFAFFHAASGRAPVSDIPHPIVGYYGAIADWVDVELITELASRKPQYSFLLIGAVHQCDVTRLRALPNVFMPGEQHYGTLPAFLKAFDACLLPFRSNRLTKGVDPVKVYEYLSQGKPVVATPLPELAEISHLLYPAQGVEEFSAQVDRALAEQPGTVRDDRIAFARASGWDVRAAALESAVAATYPLVSIVAVTYNSSEYLAPFIDSILANTTYPNHELIIVDNASSDETRLVLDAYAGRPNFRTLLLDRNRGFAGGNNAGIEAARGEYIVVINPDTIVTTGWLHRLLRPLLRDRSIGMSAPVTNFSGNQTRVAGRYSCLSTMQAFASNLARDRAGETLEIQVAPLLCAAISRALIEKVGMLDENYEIGMFEDDDFALRLRQAGYRIVTAEDCFIHHFGNGSFRQLTPEESNRIFEKNRTHFENKWKRKWTPHRTRPGVPAPTDADRIPVARFLAGEAAGTTSKLAPSLLRLIPDSTAVGQAINPQAGGRSALVVECGYGAPGTTIRFGDALLDTSWSAESNLLSAVLPTGFNDAPCVVRVALVNGFGESNQLLFRVIQ